ncbi:MAG: glycosyltransferase [Alphaproteobacteria bacterium]|nr:glycosyltransferase [Alphaproteobacteria bacterium]
MKLGFIRNASFSRLVCVCYALRNSCRAKCVSRGIVLAQIKICVRWKGQSLTQSANNSMPSVSVILPTFNRCGLIASSLDSLLNQSYPIAEILVVDDGSTDDTEAVVAAFGDKVRYIRRENGGKNAAINTGLGHAEGDLIWIMDDDDLAPVDALERLVAPFIADPSTAISYGALQKFREDPGTGAMRFERTHPYPFEDERSFFVHVMEDCFITGQPCVLVRRSCYDAIFPLPEDKVISEDYAVLLLLARRWPAKRVEGVTLFQRQHDGPRGPANIRYAADTRNARWSAADTELLRELLPYVTMGELVSRPASSEPGDALGRRQAYFQKATIAARKKLWPDALRAVRDGVRQAPDAPLGAMDQLILGRMLGCRYGLDELIAEPGILNELSSALAGLGARREAIACIATPLPYLLRCQLAEGDLRRTLCLLRIYWRLTGWRQGSWRLISKASQKIFE